MHTCAIPVTSSCRVLLVLNSLVHVGHIYIVCSQEILTSSRSSKSVWHQHYIRYNCTWYLVPGTCTYHTPEDNYDAYFEFRSMHTCAYYAISMTGTVPCRTYCTMYRCARCAICSQELLTSSRSLKSWHQHYGIVLRHLWRSYGDAPCGFIWILDYRGSGIPLHATCTTIRCYCMISTGTYSTLATGISAMSAVIMKILKNVQSKFTCKLNIYENEEMDFFWNF